MLGSLPYLVFPSRHLSHLRERRLLRRLPAHPSITHGQIDEILELLLKWQQLPVQVSTMNTIRTVWVLGPMLLLRPHWHAAALAFYR